jgi:hypothetical protein
MKKKDMQWDAPRGSENPENSLLNFPHNITLRNFWIRARSQTAAVASQFSKSQTRIGAWRTGEGPIIDFWRKPISVEEVLISSIVLVLLCATLVASFADYPYYTCCFHQLSAAIRHWDFGGLDPSQPKEFWGYSYLSALVASVTRLPDIFAIVLVSSSSFVVANYLCCRLWGTMVAAWLMVVKLVDGHCHRRNDGSAIHGPPTRDIHRFSQRAMGDCSRPCFRCDNGSPSRYIRSVCHWHRIIGSAGNTAIGDRHRNRTSHGHRVYNSDGADLRRPACERCRIPQVGLVQRAASDNSIVRNHQIGCN